MLGHSAQNQDCRGATVSHMVFCAAPLPEMQKIVSIHR